MGAIEHPPIVSLTPWGIPDHVFYMWVVMGILVLVSVAATRSLQMVPRGTQNFMEIVLEQFLTLLDEVIGHDGRRFLPLIGTLGLFILVSNLLGLVPGFVPPTSALSITAAPAIVIFLTTHVYGVREHGMSYFKHFFGPILKWYALPLMLLMLGVELISHLVRPMSLSLRLMANMTADHAVVGTFYKLQAWVIPIPVMMLGILVCIVQTLVFCLLSTMYISMAISHEEH